MDGSKIYSIRYPNGRISVNDWEGDELDELVDFARNWYAHKDGESLWKDVEIDFPKLESGWILNSPPLYPDFPKASGILETVQMATNQEGDFWMDYWFRNGDLMRVEWDRLQTICRCGWTTRKDQGYGAND